MGFLQSSEFKGLSPDESTGIQGHEKSTAFPFFRSSKAEVLLSASLPAPYAEILPHVKRNMKQSSNESTQTGHHHPWAAEATWETSSAE